MDIIFKRLSAEAATPTRTTEGAVGYDMYCTRTDYNTSTNILTCHTDIAVQLPNNIYADARARSSVSNRGLILCSGVGTIDVDYRGEITFKFYAISSNAKLYKAGERIGQLVLLPKIDATFIESDNLDETSRGCKGYGSTGE